jgi:hypothetical protein
MLVDLTADQFPDERQPPVIVCRYSKWHNSWEPLPSEERCIDEKYSKRMRESWYMGPHRKVLQAIASLKISA